MKNEPTMFSVIQEYYPDNDEYHTYAININLYKQKEKLFCSAYMYDNVVTDEDNDDFAIPKTRLQAVLNCYNTQLSGLIRRKKKEYTSSNKLVCALERETLPQRTLRNIHVSCDNDVHDKCNMYENDIIEKYTFERNTLSDKDTYYCQSILPFCVDCLVNNIVPNRKSAEYIKCYKYNCNIMELNIVELKPYFIVDNIRFKINKERKKTDVCIKSTTPYEFKKIFQDMF